MKIFLGFILISIGGLLAGMSIDDAFIANCIIKTIAAFCLYHGLKMFPKEKNPLNS